MTETSPDSNQQTQDTTPQTPGTTRNSGDSIVALPLLKEQKGPISLTLGIDKSVKNFGASVAAAIIAAIAIPTVVAIIAIVYAKSANDRLAAVETRQNDQAISNDELRRDNRIMADDLRTVRIIMNLQGLPSSHEELEEFKKK